MPDPRPDPTAEPTADPTAGPTAEPAADPAADPSAGGVDEQPGLVSARTALLGAVFLMATSAIGPGFITQTASFTVELGAAFACAIALSVLVDVAVQLNVWRVIGVSGLLAQELGNRVLPGAGYLIAALVFVGGVIFNIGNVAGTGLGTHAMLGIDPRIGGGLSALLAIGVFVSRRAGVALDRVVVVLGLLMILATLVIAITSQPPLGEAARSVVAPDTFSFLAVTTIIGGTVGGYITYAGAHRMLDSGRTGPEHVRDITRSSVVSILVTALMRILLFLAILGVVVGGAHLTASDPAGSAFRSAAGELGLRAYGLVLWAASVTSVIGAAYTSVSFLTTTRTPDRRRNLMTVAFIAVTGLIYVLVQETPVKLLVFAGTFNGLILPVGLGLLLWVAWRRRDLLGGYRYPVWLLGVGTLAWLVTLYLGWNALQMLGDL